VTTTIHIASSQGLLAQHVPVPGPQQQAVTRDQVDVAAVDLVRPGAGQHQEQLELGVAVRPLHPPGLTPVPPDPPSPAGQDGEGLHDGPLHR
jgi:hypothetical protein